jgi:hypothetical protein
VPSRTLNVSREAAPSALASRTSRPAVAEPRFSARAPSTREGLPRCEFVHRQVSGDTARAVRAALVLSEPLAHHALGHVVGHRSSVSIRGHLDDWRPWGYSDFMKDWRLLMFAEPRTEAETAAESAPLEKSPPRWRVTCSCGWERECSSEWAARSVSKLHPQLAPMDVMHATRIDGSDGDAGGQQLSLT